MIKLEVLNTQLEGKRVALADDLTVGSAERCTIRAKHGKMQPVHARFFTNEKGRYAIEVADQDAHILVNGRDVLRSELRHHDLLTVGPLRFRVIDEAFQSLTATRLDQLLEDLDEGEEEVYDFAKEDLFYLTTRDPRLRSRIAFTIPSKDRFIDQAQQFLARMVRQSGMDEMKVEAFMTCVKELILNAHRHGHKYDESKTITLRYRDEGENITVQIDDEGAGFDHAAILSEVRDVNAADAARKRYQAGGFGGLGFQMIVRMADELEYNEPGNSVKFTVSKELG